jgi:hypothetical protein
MYMSTINATMITAAIATIATVEAATITVALYPSGRGRKRRSAASP